MTPETLHRMRRLRWISFGLLVTAFMLAMFHRMAPAVLATELQQAFRVTGAQLGVLAAAYFYAYTLMQIPSGVLVDTFGARKTVSLGLTLAGVGALLFAMSDNLALAITGRFLVGLGVSGAFISTLKIASQWFYDRQFATMAGLTILLGNVGAVSGATPLSWAMEVMPWRSIFVVLAVASLGLAALVWLLVRNRPAEAGLPSMRELEGKPPYAPNQAHWREGLWLVLKNPRTWPGVVASIGQGGAFFAFAGLWVVPFLMNVYGMSRGLAANHSVMMLIGFAIGSMSVGIISDRMGKRRPVMMACFAINLIAWLPLVLGWQMPVALSLLWFALLGFTCTGYTITLAVNKEVNPPTLSGMATGVVNTGPFLGAAILQPLVGWAMDLRWHGLQVNSPQVYTPEDYRLGVGLLLGAVCIGMVFASRVHETHGKSLFAEA